MDILRYICPVCGYGDLLKPPYNESGYGSYEVCACCEFEFGCNDFPNKDEASMEWREDWVRNGYPWFARRTKPPTGWNPHEQLQRIL